MSSPLDRRLDAEALTDYERIVEAFDQEELRKICQLPERRFAREYGLRRVGVKQPRPLYRPGTGVLAEPPATVDDFFAFRNNGSNILAVAHLDTVVWADERMCDFADTADGLVVHSGALDDRLGAYVILDMLPKLGINVDVLLTTGEESGKSTAGFFYPPKGKEYNWMIEFDRGGTDVVMYQYDNKDMDTIVKASGAKTAGGAFSDISYLEHLRIKGFNWGVGYHDYHGVRGYAYLEDLFMMLGYFLRFHAEWSELRLDHDPKQRGGRVWRRSQEYTHWGSGSGSGDWWDERGKDDKKKTNEEDTVMGKSTKLDKEETSGPIVLAGSAEKTLGRAPAWGDSLATDPTDVEFVSPA